MIMSEITLIKLMFRGATLCAGSDIILFILCCTVNEDFNTISPLLKGTLKILFTTLLLGAAVFILAAIALIFPFSKKNQPN